MNECKKNAKNTEIAFPRIQKPTPFYDCTQYKIISPYANHDLKTRIDQTLLYYISQLSTCYAFKFQSKISQF